jgi:hypothetical protein
MPRLAEARPLKKVLSSHKPSFDQYVQWASERREDPQKVNPKQVLQDFLVAKRASKIPRQSG